MGPPGPFGVTTETVRVTRRARLAGVVRRLGEGGAHVDRPPNPPAAPTTAPPTPEAR